jgi:uncharacterized membrane protein
VVARRAVSGLSLWALIVATFATLGMSLLVKQPCATGDWSDGRQYRRLCYTDIVPLYGTERLTGGRLPYLDPCPSDQLQCDEYPVVTMYFMRVSAWLTRVWAGPAGSAASYSGFFYWNALLLALCGFATAWALRSIGGNRALYFAVAPTLLIYAFVNWDLLAVLLATLATLAYFRERDQWSGALLGLGAAAKLYPALLVIPFALGRWKEKRRGGAATIMVWAAIAYGAVNLPFVLAAPRQWATFFRFNATRGADWDSLWFVACRRLSGESGCQWSPRLLDFLSIVLFLAVASLLWSVKRARQPRFPSWTFGFPLLVALLLTNKVYSPQYGLWLLPWFALALPNPWLFAAFEVTDIAVFVTRFTWFGRLAAQTGDPAFVGFGGVPLGAFQIALVARAVVLVACLALWVIRAHGHSSLEIADGAAKPSLTEMPA